MNDYDNTNRGAIFRQYEKKTDNHPDYKGEINVDGKEYWVAGWKKQSKKGSNYVSLSIQEKEDRPQQDQVAEVDDNQEINLDDIPF